MLIFRGLDGFVIFSSIVILYITEGGFTRSPTRVPRNLQTEIPIPECFCMRIERSLSRNGFGHRVARCGFRVAGPSIRKFRIRNKKTENKTIDPEPLNLEPRTFEPVTSNPYQGKVCPLRFLIYYLDLARVGGFRMQGI